MLHLWRLVNFVLWLSKISQFLFTVCSCWHTHQIGANIPQQLIQTVAHHFRKPVIQPAKGSKTPHTPFRLQNPGDKFGCSKYPSERCRAHGQRQTAHAQQNSDRVKIPSGSDLHRGEFKHTGHHSGQTSGHNVRFSLFNFMRIYFNYTIATSIQNIKKCYESNSPLISNWTALRTGESGYYWHDIKF